MWKEQRYQEVNEQGVSSGPRKCNRPVNWGWRFYSPHGDESILGSLKISLAITITYWIS